MYQQRSFGNQASGVLYLVPTPIGNLQDMTPRAIAVLGDVDHILAEDTRHTQKLLTHWELTTPQLSFHEHNVSQRVPQIIAALQAGESFAQVSDAGMPSISDPGKELVAAAVAAELPVVPLPGPTAGVTALIASGLVPQPFYFHGFLPRKASQQVKTLTDLAEQTATLIFYEAPHRLQQTLASCATVFGTDRPVVVARELTKKYETFVRGTLAEVRAVFAAEQPRGEFVVLVAGATPAGQTEPNTDLAADPTALRAAVAAEIAAGRRPNAAIKQVAQANGLPRQTVYNHYHDIS